MNNLLFLGRSFSVAGYIRIFIGVGLVALFAMVSSVGIMCYNKYGTLSSFNPEHRLKNDEIFALI